jgi:hypothetical protein
MKRVGLDTFGIRECLLHGDLIYWLYVLSILVYTFGLVRFRSVHSSLFTFLLLKPLLLNKPSYIARLLGAAST